jgi:cytochrome P450
MIQRDLLPASFLARRSLAAVWHPCTHMQRAAMVLPLIGAANRDPARYVQPDTLDITRNEGSSLAFGSGPHVCIGAALTRIETEMVLREVLRRWPELSLLESEPGWGSNPAYRGLVTLPMQCGSVD